MPTIVKEVLDCVYALIFFALLASAGYIALWKADAGRRKDGYRVLRLVLASGGLAELALHLHAAGLL